MCLLLRTRPVPFQSGVGERGRDIPWAPAQAKKMAGRGPSPGASVFALGR